MIMIFQTCKGCDVFLTLAIDHRLFEPWCKDCKQVAEECYTGFYCTMGVYMQYQWVVLEYSTYNSAAYIGRAGEEMRRIVGFDSPKDAALCMKALAKYHGGYVVRTKLEGGEVVAPHPIYL